MKDNSFFKPTVTFKEYMILDMIEKNPFITQREMSNEIGIAVSMVNDYLNQLEEDKLVKRKKHSTKTVEYLITSRGLERRKVLTIEFLSSSQKLYNNAKNSIHKFLENAIKGKPHNLILYGAGDVAEILLQSIIENKEFGINVIGIADDEVLKQGTKKGQIEIKSLKEIITYDYDAILVSSYNNRHIMTQKLYELGISKTKIINFFDGE